MALHIRHWATAVLPFTFVMFLGWYAGTNFLTRAEPAFWFGEACGPPIVFRMGRRIVDLPQAPPSPRVRRPLWIAAAFLFTLAEGWYGGVDYFMRGEEQAYMLGLAIMFAGLTSWCPVWKPIQITSFGPK